MRIEFKDDGYEYRRKKPIPEGVYQAEIVDIKLTEKDKKFIRVDFYVPDLGMKVSRNYSTEKEERWKLKILLNICGIQKDEKRNMYSFDTEELIGKKIVITIKDNKVIRVDPYIETE